MSKNKTLGICVWAILFALSIFLLFIIPEHYPNSIYVVLIFDCIAFISQLIVWLKLLKKDTKPNEAFLSTPTIMISIAYMIIQFIICIITAIVNDGISLKLSLIINVVVMALMWILILITEKVKNHANRVDSRQRNHHIEL